MNALPRRDEISDWEDHRLKTCRVSSIHFSDLENPTGVTLVVSEPAFEMIATIIGKRPRVVGMEQYGGGRWIELSLDDVHRLRVVCGETRPIDDDYVIKSPIYDMAIGICNVFEEWDE